MSYVTVTVVPETVRVNVDATVAVAELLDVPAKFEVSENDLVNPPVSMV